eukprot:COSAG02_NODE_47954_length_337_cov_1.046218_2_plen_42_part_01
MSSNSAAGDLQEVVCLHIFALRYYHTTAGYNVSLGMETCVSA